MNFNDLKTKYLPIIETALEKAIEFPSIDDNRSILKSAIEHSVSTPGKRIRPLICLSIETALNSSNRIALPIGVAIELVHCYSLIHDDLPAMDNDDFRRGKPTCHKAYGEAIAILAGDTLNTYAFEYLINHLQTSVSPKTLIDITKEFASSCGIHGMAGGQVLDLTSSNQSPNPMSQLKKIHALKTGALLKACFSLTTKACSSDSRILSVMDSIGTHFGLLFQIIDDILDETGSLSSLGKSPGKDSAQNKLTYVSLLGLEGAQKEAEHQYREAMTALNSLDTPFPELASIINTVYEKGSVNAI
ncbi:MAG: polyprenyl synthetase family protein [Candidatus Marinamargulisbacteria bacterium]